MTTFLSREMNLMATFLLALWSLIEQVNPAFVINHVWPLGNTTCGYDVVTRADARQPNLTSCFVGFGSQHPDLPYKSISLDGFTFLDLPALTDYSTDLAWIIINVKPARLGGTLLHFTDDCTDRCILNFLVTLETTGEVKVTLESTDMGQATFAVPVIRIAAGKWNHMAFSFDPHACYMNLNHQTEGGTNVQQRATISPCPSKWEGHFGHKGDDSFLRIGARKDGTDFFRGEVTCAMVATAIAYTYSSTLSYCDGNNYSPPSISPVTAVSPRHVFPLRNKQAGFDTKQMKDVRVSNDTKDLRPDDTVVPVLGYGSLYMDGSPLSMVDLFLPFSALHSDFTMALYVKMAEFKPGVLAHAKINSAASGAMTEVVIRFNETHITGQLTKGGGSNCGQVTLPSPSMNDWAIISIARSSGQVFLTAGMDRVTGAVSCTGGTAVTGNGVFRLGGYQGDEEGFHGKMTCFVLFDKSLTPGVAMQSTLDSCKISVTIPAGAATPKPTMTKYDFKLFTTDAEPEASLTTGMDVTMGPEFKVRSLADCAKECRLYRHCRSFTVSKVKDSSRERRCRLLDFLTREGLQARSGTNYYVMTLVDAE